MAKKWQQKIKILLLFLVAIIPFLITSSLLYLKDPMPWPDEGILLDIANNRTTHGAFSTTLYGDAVPWISQQADWYPPAYSYMLSIWTSAFGTSIATVRAFSLLFGLLSLAVFFQVAKYTFSNYYYATLATLLLSIDPSFNQSSRIGRMDILAFFFILGSFSAILKALNSTNKKLYFYSGIFSSLAILTHTIALLAPAIIVPTILLSNIKFRAKITAIFSFSIPIALGFVIWFLTILKSLNIFVAQMQMQLAKKAAIKSWIFHRWADGQWRILIVLCLLSILIFAFYTHKSKGLKSYFLLIGIVVSSVAVIYGKEMWYFIYFQPFLALILISLYKISKEHLSGLKQISIKILLLVIVFINFNLIFSKITNFSKGSFDYNNFSNKIAENVEPNSTVLLSVIPDPYLALRGKNGLKFYEFPPLTVPHEKYKELLDSSDYVVLNAMFIFPEYTQQYLEKNSLSSKIVGENSGYQTRIFKLKPISQRGL